MAIDATDAAKLRIGAVGVSVDTTLDPATLATTWTSTGPAGNRNTLNTAERIITRAINALDVDINAAKLVTDGFEGRFNSVVGNEGGADQAAFTALGGNIIQAVHTLQTTGGGPGTGGPSNWVGGDFTESDTTVIFGPNLTPNAPSLANGFTVVGGGAAAWDAQWQWGGNAATNIQAWELTEPTVAGQYYWLIYNIYQSASPPGAALYLRTGPTVTAGQQVVRAALMDTTVAAANITFFIGQATGAFTHLVLVATGNAAAINSPRLRHFVPSFGTEMLSVAPTVGAGWTQTSGSGFSTTFTLATGTAANLTYTLARPIEPGRSYLVRWRSTATANLCTLRFQTSPSDTTGAVTIGVAGWRSADWAQVVSFPYAFTHVVVVGSSSNGGTFSFQGISPIEGTINSTMVLNGFPVTIKDKNVLFGSTPQTLTHGEDNLSLGLNALLMVSSGSRNIAIGEEALRTISTPVQNIAVGYRALRSNMTGANNIAIGTNTLGLLTTGASNVAIGSPALANHTTASNIVCIGLNSGQNTTTGGNNVYVGEGSGRVNTTGTSIVAIGYRSLYNGPVYAATNNTAVGANTLYSIGSGTRNVALGVSAMYSVTTGSNNISIGVNSGRYTTGTTAETAYENSIFIGDTSRTGGTGRTNQIVIGWDTTGSGSNTVRLGNNAQAMPLFVGNSSQIAGTSDARLKEEVEPADLNKCLEAVMALPVTRWKWAEFAGPRFDWHVTGWMADDVERVFPKAVITSDEEYADRRIEGCKATMMGDALPTLWGAVQKLIEKNEDLEREVVELRRMSNGRK